MNRPVRPRPSWQTTDPLRWPATSCSCTRCQKACTSSPGWFRPQEIARLARHLELDVETTFRRFLAIGTVRVPDGRDLHGIMPHKLLDRKKPGSKWKLAEMARDGRCIFYDRGQCTIHAVRPFECARATHGGMDRAVKLRHAIVAEWTMEKLAPLLAWADSVTVRRPGRHSEEDAGRR
jgi:Fe-S-cluster containining protein